MTCRAIFPIPALLMLVLGMSSASQALANDEPQCAEEAILSHEFDYGISDVFGVVDVSESQDGGIDFVVEIDPKILGKRADLHRLYFNLDGEFSGVWVESADPVHTLYTVEADRSVAGGAGASFGYAVSFGNGAGKKGNRILQYATFTILADQVLKAEDLLLRSSTSEAIEAHIAIHVQGTDYVDGSETIGGLLEGDCPDPTATPTPGPIDPFQPDFGEYY